MGREIFPQCILGMDGDTKLFDGGASEVALEILRRREVLAWDVTRREGKGNQVGGEGVGVQLEAPSSLRRDLHFCMVAVRGA